MNSGVLLAISQVAISGGSFLRNVLLARILGVEDYGVAITYSLLIAFVESFTFVAFDKYIVQSSHGKNRRILSTIHGLSVLRSIVAAVFLYLISLIYSNLLDVDSETWAYLLLALSVFVRGWVHYGFAVDLRGFNYRTISLMEGISQVFATAVIIPVLYLYPEPEVAVLMFLVINILYVIVSHLVTNAPYVVGITCVLVPSMYKYVAPLTISSIISFIVMQGDKLLIGVYYSASALALYAATFSLFNVPVIFVQRYLSQYFTPRIAALRHSAEGLNGRPDKLLLSFAVILFSSSLIGFISLGSTVTGLVFGDDYLISQQLLVFLALVNSLWMLRAAPVIISTALGDPILSVRAGYLRALGFALAVSIAIQGLGVKWIALAGCAGEILSLVYGVYYMRVKHQLEYFGIAFILKFFIFTSCVVLLSLSEFELFKNPLYQIPTFLLVMLAVFYPEFKSLVLLFSRRKIK